MHDASLVRKVAVNIAYPDALAVESAVWEAQKAGWLPVPDVVRLQATGEDRKALDEMAFRKTVEALKTFGSLLDSKTSGAQHADVSVLLVDEMMWNRFSMENGHTDLLADISEPQDDDLVIVTETSVIMAMVSASLSIDEAVDMRVLRLYGAPTEVQKFLSRFGRSNVDTAKK